MICSSTGQYKQCCAEPEKDIWLYTDMSMLLDYAMTGYPQERNKELGNMLLARVYPKLYKAELAKSVRFKEDIKMSEDNLYSFEILNRCHRVGITDACWYHYYQNEYSLTHHNDGNMENRQKEQQDFAREIETIEAQSGPETRNACHIRLFHIFINYFYTLTNNMSNLGQLKTMLHTSWGDKIQGIDLSPYQNQQSSDRKFQYLLRHRRCLYRYFLLRCIRRKLGDIKRNIQEK